MKNICTGIVMFAVFMLLGFAIVENFLNITHINTVIAQFFGSIRTPAGIEFMKSMTTFGETSILTPIVILSLLFFLFKKHWEFGVMFALSIWITQYVMIYSKNLFEIVRPSPFYGNASGYSYPSGHVSSATVVFFILTLYFLTVKNKIIRYAGVTICTLATIGVGISRMYLNVHWFTDVIGGVLLAVSCSLVLYGIIQMMEKKNA